MSTPSKSTSPRPGAGSVAGPARDPSTSAPLPADLEGFVRGAAASDEPVLLYGETGTGKTWLARRIHEFSPRRDRPIVEVNCAAIPEPLLEDEMFGHAAGSFTGAKRERKGLFEEANGGTLFLDEVAEMCPALQVKLLKALDDGSFRRVGENCRRIVDVRVMAATICDQDALIEGSKLRPDLYYRLAVLEERVPPLRERLDQLPGLIEWSLDQATRGSRSGARLDRSARVILHHYHWPGNLRQLDNALRCAVTRMEGETIRAEHLPERVRTGAVKTSRGKQPRTGSPSADGSESGARYHAPDDPAEEIESIRRALEATGGNVTHAASRLGMARSTLHVKLIRYGAQLEI